MVLTTIAETRGPLRDFRPYVACVDERGVVSFQAALERGSGVFAGDGGPLVAVVASEELLGDVISHPDRAADGTTCFYAQLASGGQAVVRVREGRLERLAETGERFAEVGPLGPTMNEAGDVAFRATLASGHSGVFLADGRSVHTIHSLADTEGPCEAFFGLPVVDERGRVVFRAALRSGGHAILAAFGGATEILAQTGERFRELAWFPCANDRGLVVFAATLTQGGAGIFGASGGEIAQLHASDDFESFRGALVDDAGALSFLATPLGGRLGLFTSAGRVLGLGDPLLGSEVTELALNPVSVNRRGQLALRICLAPTADEDERQLIVRAEPPA
jgi:hypothetical protein